MRQSTMWKIYWILILVSYPFHLFVVFMPYIFIILSYAVKKKTHTHKGEVYRFVQGFYVTPTKPVQYKIIVPASKYRDAVSHSLFNVFSMIPFYFIGSLLIFLPVTHVVFLFRYTHHLEFPELSLQMVNI